jgi:acyl-CoA synthetase (AMP-forming)/AMP-acid ligase II
MIVPMPEPGNLGAWITASGAAGRTITIPGTTLDLDDFASTTRLGVDARYLAGRSIILLTGDALSAAAALIELDGLARRIVLCPPGFDIEIVAAVVRDAQADAILHDGSIPSPAVPGVDLVDRCGLPAKPMVATAPRNLITQWALMTSGTTGVPKIVVHTLATLARAIKPAPHQNWATFYDIRRYGGLQILLRALIGTGSLTLPGRDEPTEDFLIRCATAGITHISGTPSHWRRVLMSQSASRINPQYVRLSGEIADSAVLNALAALYPRARIAHAYASTEAGVGFSVDDGLPGFPAAFVENVGTEVALRVVNGALQVSSPGRALKYLGVNAPALVDADGFIDTGDLVERRGERYHFVGRRDGIINIGGAKVHPEEVEAIVNMQAGVRASLVRARKNPIIGALIAADVVLEAGVGESPALRAAIIDACRARLAPYKVPALVRFVPALAMTAGGKLARHG